MGRVGSRSNSSSSPSLSRISGALISVARGIRAAAALRRKADVELSEHVARAVEEMAAKLGDLTRRLDQEREARTVLTARIMALESKLNL